MGICCDNAKSNRERIAEQSCGSFVQWSETKQFRGDYAKARTLFCFWKEQKPSRAKLDPRKIQEENVVNGTEGSSRINQSIIRSLLFWRKSLTSPQMSTNVNLKQNIPAFVPTKVIASAKGGKKTRVKRKNNGEGRWSKKKTWINIPGRHQSCFWTHSWCADSLIIMDLQ